MADQIYQIYQIITIDGPAGAGKTTVSKALAKALGCVYVDTGALYRGVAHEIDQQKINWKDSAILAEFLKTLDLNFVMDNQDLVLTSSGKDITPFIRTPEISMLASATSAVPMVRDALLDIQKQIGASRDAVFEGRDMGTTVFPHAQFKFFLFADLSIRAKRRYDEMEAKGDLKNAPRNSQNPKGDLKKVEQEMGKRDSDDSNRETSPLKPSQDAIQIDSTYMNVQEVVKELLSHIGRP